MKRQLFAGALLLTSSFALAGILTVKAVEKSSFETKADSVNYTLTVDASSTDWNTLGAITKIHAFKNGGAGEQWYILNHNDSGIYAFDIDTTLYDTINVVRVNSENISDADWDGKWNQTQNIGLDTSKNRIKITSLNDDNCGYSYFYCNTIAANEKFYVDATPLQDWWGEADKVAMNTYIDFIYCGTHTFKQMSKVQNSIHFYTLDIGETPIDAEMIIVVRSNAPDAGHWDDTIKNKTSDIVFNGTNDGYRAVTLLSDYYGETAHDFQTKNDLYVANAYGRWYLDLKICKDEGGLWGAATSNNLLSETVYNAIVDNNHLDDDNYIKNASNQGSEPINVAMLRYDTLMYKNQDVNNWMKRASYVPIPGAYIVNAPSNPSSDYASYFLVGVAALGLVGAGALTIAKRRREE